MIDGTPHLLCRAEESDATWSGAFLDSRATPVWCTLNRDFSLRTATELTYDHVDGCRPEDWRLFRHDGRLLTNHSLYSFKNGRPACRCAISQVDVQSGRIDQMLVLEPPLVNGPEEKNWAMFSQDGRLYCIYSIDPYIVFEIRLDTGRTEIILSQDLPRNSRLHELGAFISNSTNPIDWDSNHYISFVHCFFEDPSTGDRNRLYLQFGILIDRNTLAIRSVIPDPLVVGGAEDGRHPGVHYTMSLLTEGDHLFAFYGEGDMHTGVAIIKRRDLNDLFRQHVL